MIGEILVEALEFVFQDLWMGATEATHERFGWIAATVVAVSPIVMIGLIIWLIVFLAPG